MPAVGFDSKNPFLKNRYASLGAVIAAARPVLAKYGLAVVQLPVTLDGKIGVNTVLVHKSGEWLEETMVIEPVQEKGKSVAQMAGSVITYLRRYAFASTLALYADEDDDGNVQERGGYEPGGRFEDLPKEPPTGGKPSTPAPAAKTPAAPAAASKPAAPTGNPMVAELVKRLGANLPEFVRCLQERDADGKGGVVLVNKQGIDKVPDAWAKFFLSNWEEEVAKVDLWCAQNPPSNGSRPIEVPRDENIDYNSPDAPWRSFPIPWGQHKGVTLSKLDKKVLFGFWANFVVETEYKGQPKKPETVAADTRFRQMLDEAGMHYEFHK
jgi:hypothetical protein